jgi:hypothetical protein
MCRAPLRRLLFAVVATAIPRAVVAQGQSRVALKASRHDTLSIGTAGAVTTVFSLHNRTSDSARVTPKLELPDGWTTLAAPATIMLPPRATDTWLAGVAAPATAIAGVYVIRASLLPDVDSVLVRIPERRAIEVASSDAPAFVAGGDQYELRFTVHNRGNVADTLAIDLKSSAGSRVDLDASSAKLAPGELVMVIARLTSLPVGRQAVEDVAELTVTDRARKDVTATASSNVLVVKKTDRRIALGSVPAELTVRGAEPGTGVSPLALTGSGPIAPNSNTKMDFAFRLPPGTQTIFGERDEYRVDLTNDAYKVRLGDGSHSFSPLSSSGTMGFGGEVQRTAKTWATGAYVARDRWTPNGETESALFAQRKFAGDKTSVSTVLVGRNGGARVAAIDGRAALGSHSQLEVETAQSDSAGVVGLAHRAQLLGAAGWMRYDAGWLHSTPTFAGATRGNDYKHASFNMHPGGPVSLGVTTGDYASTMLVGTDAGAQFQTKSTLVEATTVDGNSLSYERLTQESDGATPFGSLENSVRARGHYALGRLDFRAGVGHHVVTGRSDPRSFESFDAAVHADLHNGQGADVYVERNSGASINSLQALGVTVGVSAALHLPLGTFLYANASTMMSSQLLVTGMSQGDLSLRKPLPNGMTLALRDHVAILPNGVRPVGMNGVYLELRTPLSIPTLPVRTPGRVTGRVVDAATGRGLPNVLVRVGNEAVITDDDGRVALSGLQAGKYAVNIESGDRTRAGVTVGDATIEVPAGPRGSVEFASALAVGARVHASVRQAAFGFGAMTADRDSLIDAGAMDNVVVALMSARDTIYQTTGPDGLIDFGVLPPGSWTARVIADDTPAFHAFDKQEYSFIIRGGEQRDLDFHLIPQRRSVTLMASDEPEVLSVATRPAADTATATMAHDAPATPERPGSIPTKKGPRVAAHETPEKSRRPTSVLPVQLQGEPRAEPTHTATSAPVGGSHLWTWLVAAVAAVLVFFGFRPRRRA